MSDAQPTENRRPDHPQKNDTWVDDDGELYTYNGKKWVPFEDVPYFEPDSPFRDH